jgi:hypothetical protein
VLCLEKEVNLVDILLLDDRSYNRRSGARCEPNCNRTQVFPRAARHSCHVVICRASLAYLVNRPVGLVSRNTIFEIGHVNHLDPNPEQ